MPGLTLDEWGRGAWNTLHVFAHTAPVELTTEERERFQTFLYTFAAYLPCPTCRRHFEDFLRRRVNEQSLSTRASIVSLLNDAHNEVNARTGKRIYSLEDHYDVYSLSSTRRRRRRAGVVVRDLVLVVLIGVVAARLARRPNDAARGG